MAEADLDKNLEALERYLDQNDHHQICDINYNDLFDVKIVQIINSFSFYSCFLRCCHGNYLKVVERLIQKKPEVLIESTNDETPLEIACFQGHEALATLLLSHFERESFEKSTVDKLICEALCLSIKRLRDEDKTEKRQEIFKKIFETTKERRIDTEEYKDSYGHAALYYANYYNFPEIELKLLETVSLTKTHEGLCTIDKIDPVILKRHLDNCITVEKRNETVEIIINYGILCPSPLDETGVIYQMSDRRKLQNLLTHPVILCFLSMKWHISIYKIWFWLSMMLLVVEISMFCGHMIYINTPWFKIIFTVLHLVQLAPCTLDKIFMSMSFYATTIIWISNSFDPEISKLLLFATNAMLLFKLVLLSRIYSPYAEMFKIILLNFFKILMWYIFVLFLPLTCGYYFIFYHNEIQNANITVTNFTRSFYNVFTLSIGNIAEASSTVTITNTLVTLFFVFVIPIAFFNLLTAQAVSDIGKLKKEANAVSLREKIRFIYNTEGLFRDIFKGFNINVFKTDSRDITFTINCTSSSEIGLDKKIIDSLNTFMEEREERRKEGRKEAFIYSAFLKQAKSITQICENVENDEINENGKLV